MSSHSRLPLRFWIVSLVAFINAVGFTLIIPLIYPYAKQFGLNDFQASLLTTSYAASQFIGTPILGRLSDRLGRKPLLIVSLLGTVVAESGSGASHGSLAAVCSPYPRWFDGGQYFHCPCHY